MRKADTKGEEVSVVGTPYMMSVLVPQQWETAEAFRDNARYEKLLSENWEPYSIYTVPPSTALIVAFKRPVGIK